LKGEAMAELKKKATNRGVEVKNPKPDDFENIRLSKKDFVAKAKAQKEREAKIKEYAESLDKPKAQVEDKVEAPITPEAPKKKMGRPKRIE
jgi:hypothetical protein